MVSATHGIDAQCGGPVHDQAAVIMPILDPPAAQARRLVALGPPQPIGIGGGAAGTPWQLGSIMPAAGGASAAGTQTEGQRLRRLR